MLSTCLCLQELMQLTSTSCLHEAFKLSLTCTRHDAWQHKEGKPSGRLPVCVFSSWCSCLAPLARMKASLPVSSINRLCSNAKAALTTAAAIGTASRQVSAVSTAPA